LSVGSVASAALSLLKPVGIGYAALCGAIFVFQRQLQYFPSKAHPPSPGAIHPAFRDVHEVELLSADGTRCLAWHWPAPPAGAAVPPFFWLRAPGIGGYTEAALRAACGALREQYPLLSSVDVLMFHGNAGDRSHRLGWMHLLRDGLGLSVTVLDYRGYGGSAGSPSEEGLIADGLAAALWLRSKRASEGAVRPMVLWGESIGSGVAIALAAQGGQKNARVGEVERGGARGEARGPGVKPDAIVLEAGLASCVDIAAKAYPFLPIRLPLLMRDRFDNAVRAKRMPPALPVLQIHGGKDELVPLADGEALFRALPATRKRMVVLGGAGHNDVPYYDPRRYLAEVAAFLHEEVLQGRPAGAEGS
jgi:fermentation-respiration switch protein FrsA (DUF1100 family)